MIDWLDEASFPQFPPPHKALDDPNGLLAAGGRVTPVWLDQAYRRGIFPWNDPDEVRLWWSPAPRAIITPDSFRIPRSVRKAIRRQNYRVTTNLAFTDVMTACAAPRTSTPSHWRKRRHGVGAYVVPFVAKREQPRAVFGAPNLRTTSGAPMRPG